MQDLLEAASHCLRSYQFGNSAPGLAKEMADACDKVVRKSRGEVYRKRLERVLATQHSRLSRAHKLWPCFTSQS